MAVSRIFIKNLPPNLKEEEFKNHFSSLAPVTDARYIPKRRIGYVGYKTPETAIKATKYFNKSFIRTSRIHVELAKPVAESEPRKRPRIYEDAPQQSSGARVEPQIEAANPKLQEFLSTMGAPSRGKTWANEEVPAAVPLPAAQILEKEDEASDGEYQTISRKRKRDSEHEESGQEAASVVPATIKPTGVDASNRDAAPAADIDVSTDKEEESLQDVPEIDATTAVTASDSDWLRSKTNRLLGLVDDDELDNDPLAADSHEASKAHTKDNEEMILLKPSSSPDRMDAANDTSPPEALETIRDPDTTNTGRLFIRNLSYGTTEAELRELLAEYGTIEEIHVSRDTRSGISRGYSYAQFSSAEEAQVAQENLDGKPFQGRLLHILYAKDKKAHGLDEYQISKLPLKKQQEIRRKMEASTSTFKWNSMFMSPDAILSSVASRLGVSKSDLLDPTSIDAAVKQAHAETNVVKEAKAYFANHGVNLDAFKGKEYSDTAILVKNFPYGTSSEELKKMFEAYGTVKRLLIPPSATIAVVEMEQATQSKSAFHSLAYRKFKDSILFLEKAPKALFTSSEILVEGETAASKPTTIDLLAQDEPLLTTAKSTLFIRNLNFSTTSLDLRDLFMPLNGFLSATVKTKQDSKRPGQTLSMGFGFVEFRTKEEAQSAMTAMNGYKLVGHELMIKESNKAIDAAEERRKEEAAKKLAGQRTKIIIRNLPFEATKRDVRALFGPYGQLKTVRVPRKFDSTSRGFAFAEFVTTREAENAVKSLTGIHLLGRRLNLEFAASDTLDAHEELEKMSKKVQKQADKVAIQNLTNGGRKKFSVHQGEDVD